MDMKIIGGVRYRAEHVPEGTPKADVADDRRDRAVRRNRNAAALAQALDTEAPAPTEAADAPAEAADAPTEAPARRTTK